MRRNVLFGPRQVDDSLPLIRLAQRDSGNASHPHNHQVSLVDHGYLFGHYGSIHPMDKTPVGKRLMLSARQHAYAEPGIVASGPEPLKAALSATGRAITLSFEPGTVPGADGLMVRAAGAVRQRCPVGLKQVSGNPTNATVPLSQCGCPSGFEVGTATAGTAAAAGAAAAAAAGPPPLSWACVDVKSLSVVDRTVTMAVPAAAVAGANAAGAVPVMLRYLFADWPTPTVYAAQSFLGENGQLPTPPFTMEVTR